MKTTAILALPYPESTDSADVPRDIKALAEKLDPPGGGNGAFIIGEVRFIAIANPPAGWLVADGRAVSRATYAALFAAIAAVFGAGDGSTTFNIPDLRGRSPVGAGQGTGLTNRAVGTKWGVEAVVLATAQMPAHAHGASDSGHYHTPAGGGAYEVTRYGSGLGPDPGAQPGWFPEVVATDSGFGYAAITIANNGGGQSHDNTAPALAIPAYIYSGA